MCLPIASAFSRRVETLGTATKLSSKIQDFITKQPLFFVATAAPDGRVNVSPKGLDSLRILDANRIVWINLSGSGNETAAHLRENSRMTLMFCAISGPALIVRTYGQAKTYHPADAEWQPLEALFPKMAGARQIFDLSIDLVQTSCGTGVPLMDIVKQRGDEELLPYYDKMGPDGVKAYWQRKNRVSIDHRPTGIE